MAIYCKDGKKFKVSADYEEFKLSLGNIIVKHSPDVIIGYVKEQKKQHLLTCPEVAKRRGKNNTVFGIILCCIGIALLVISLINGKTNPMGYVLLTALFTGGGFLIYSGSKK